MEETVKIEVPDGMEWCRKCGEVKPRDCFNKHMGRRSGLQCYCKVCHCAFSLEWREERRRRLGILPRRILSIEERLQEHTGAGKNGCLLWTGCLLPTGYGYITIHAHPCYVHRIAYELAVGPIPEGLTIDHLCGVRNCINTEHMEPVPIEENSRRGAVNWWHGVTEVPEYEGMRPDGGPIGLELTSKRRDKKRAEKQALWRMDCGHMAVKLGISRQRVHQIVKKKGIGVYIPGKNGHGKWQFTDTDVEMMTESKNEWMQSDIGVLWQHAVGK